MVHEFLVTFKLCIFFLFFIRMCCSNTKSWPGRFSVGRELSAPMRQCPSSAKTAGPLPGSHVVQSPWSPTHTSPSFLMGSQGLSIKKEDPCTHSVSSRARRKSVCFQIQRVLWPCNGKKQELHFRGKDLPAVLV